MRPVKIIVEKHADGYVAYPLGIEGVPVQREPPVVQARTYAPQQ